MCASTASTSATPSTNESQSASHSTAGDGKKITHFVVCVCIAYTESFTLFYIMVCIKIHELV